MKMLSKMLRNDQSYLGLKLLMLLAFMMVASLRDLWYQKVNFALNNNPASQSTWTLSFIAKPNPWQWFCGDKQQAWNSWPVRKNCVRIVQLKMIYLELISSVRDNVTVRSAMTYKIHTFLTTFYCSQTFPNIQKQLGKQSQLHVTSALQWE